MSKNSKWKRKLRHTLFSLVMWTWCLPQTLIGLGVLAAYSNDPRRNFHGALLCVHSGKFGGLSMGKFIFASGRYRSAHMQRICLHEYGHCIQSLMLGPLYLPVVAIPSALWCNLPVCKSYRAKNNVDYYSFYTEKWADRLAYICITKKTQKAQHR